MKLLITIPAYNEEKILRQNVLAVAYFLAAEIKNYDWQIIISDNNSTDKTKEIAQKLAAENDKIKYFFVKQKGKGAAVISAWLAFDADIYCFMDADLSTDLSALPKLISAIAKDGADIAYGSRFAKGAQVERGWLRSLFSSCYRFIAKLILNLKISDLPCGFKAINKKVKDELLPKITNQEWFFDSELLILGEKLGYKMSETPVVWREPRSDSSESKVKILSLSFDYFKKILAMKTRLNNFKKNNNIKISDLILNPLMFMAVIIALMAGAIYWVATWPDLEQHFSYLANAFLEGRLDLKNIPPMIDIASFAGKTFVYFGPIPAILLMPAVAIFGLNFHQQWLSLIFTIINFYLIFKLSNKLGIAKKIDAFWLAFFYIFGSVYLFVSFSLYSAYLPQVIGTTFFLLALLNFFGKRNWLAIGSFIALAGLTRYTLYSASLFFLLNILIEKNFWKIKIKTLLKFFIPIILSLIILAIYNYLRFGSFMEVGYNYNETISKLLILS
ncbi:MAG: glycosyltransferase [Patescibacteria group bacterium]